MNCRHDIIEWLSGDECHDLDEAGLASSLGRRLKAAGLLIDRLVLHLRMLHPELVGHAVTWAPDEPVKVHDRRHGYLGSPLFAGSPLRRVMETGQPELVSHGHNGSAPWMHSDVFQERRLVECFIVSLGNKEGSSAVSFCTASQCGFSIAERTVLKRIVPALRNVCELNIRREDEQMLLDTHIGSGTARRILAGNVRRGHAETLEVALLLCDLRGFTELSNRLPSARVMQLRRRIPAPMRGGLADITCMAYTHSADPNDQDRSCGEDQFSNPRIHIHAPSSTLVQNNQHGKFKRRSRYLPKQISPPQPHAITERHAYSSRRADL